MFKEKKIETDSVWVFACVRDQSLRFSYHFYKSVIQPMARGPLLDDKTTEGGS